MKCKHDWKYQYRNKSYISSICGHCGIERLKYVKIHKYVYKRKNSVIPINL